MSRLFTGDETGLLKDVSMQSKTVVGKWGVQDRALAIRRLCFRDGAEQEVLAGLASGALARLSLHTGEYATLREGLCTAPICGLDSRVGRVIVGDESGAVTFWREADDTTQVIQAAQTAERVVAALESAGKFATGGKDSNLRLWDVQAPDAPVFRAKNLKPDTLQLERPVWITDLAFVPGAGDVQIVAGTAHHTIVMFDTRASARAVLNVDVGEHPVKAVAVPPTAQTVLVGNSIGSLSALELRTGTLVGGFKGFGGSCRSLACHPSLPLFAACGLDRFVRVYDLQTRACTAKVYLRQRQHCVLFSAAVPSANADGAPGTPFAASVGDNSGAAPESQLDSEDVWGLLDGESSAVAAVPVSPKMSKKIKTKKPPGAAEVSEPPSKRVK